jgi:hypothetical protein
MEASITLMQIHQLSSGLVFRMRRCFRWFELTSRETLFHSQDAAELRSEVCQWV